MRKPEEMETAGIRPGMGILGLLSSLDYEPWYALGELVDNAVASYRKNQAEIRRRDDAYQFEIKVDIDHSKRKMTIRDNAAGIDSTDFQRALITGEPPAEVTDLNRFGMGMKSACCWWSKEWTLTTTALGENIGRRVTFDIPRIVSEEQEEIEIEVFDADADEHFTELQLTKMTKTISGMTLGKTRAHLADMYQRFLEGEELNLVIQGERVEYVEPDVLVAPIVGSDSGTAEIRWIREFSFELSGKPVKGHAYVRAKGATRTNGLSLFWKDRLIKGSADTPYRPVEIYGSGNTFRSQRLQIAVDLDHFEPNNTKTGFTWPNGEEEFLQRLRGAVETDPSMLNQAEQYRARQPQDDVDGQEVNAQKEAVEKASEPIEEMSGSIEGVIEWQEEGESKASNPSPAQVKVSQTREVVVRGALWRVTIELVDQQISSGAWYEVFADKPGATRNLVLKIFRTSPFFVGFGTLDEHQIEPQIRIAIALGISETLGHDDGVSDAPYLREIFNRLLNEELSQPSRALSS